MKREWSAGSRLTGLFSPVKIVLIYILVGAAWILLSDELLARLVTDPVPLSHLQTAKGWLFILVTALLLYWLIRKSVEAVGSSEEALRERDRALTTLLSNLPGMAYRCRNDQDWTMEFVSEGCLELTGYHSSALLHNRKVSYGELIHPDDREKVWEGVQADVRDENPFQLSYRIKTAEGKEKWVWERGRGVFNSKRELEALEGIILDVSQQKALEEQLQQSQKMEAVGRLAGGVAHDFNNMLNVITGYSELLLDSAGQDQRQRRMIEQIHKAGGRAAALTRQLLAFSRKQVLQPRVLDLNAVVTDMEKMLRRLIGEDIQLATQLDPKLARVKADPSQIEQVVMNLVVNARDAMPEGGRLTLQTGNVNLDDAYIQWHIPVRTGAYVMLSISDTGTGMDAEAQAHLFEPFFTTKPAGKGTGLGLSTVYGIIKQSGGYIWVYSEPGQGSTFKVYLPRVEPATEATEKEAAGPPLLRSSETILVVEDTEPVRQLACEFLKMSGFQVLEAKEGAEALEIARNHPGPIHLLLTDVMLPGLGGPEVAQQLVELRPQAKVIYMSGYATGAFPDATSLAEDTVLLQKPFTRAGLLQKVREVLDASPTAL